MVTWEDLCLFCGGSADSFTGLLLALIAKADPGNRERLRAGFLEEVAAWETWQSVPPGMTAGELAVLIRERGEDWSWLEG